MPQLPHDNHVSQIVCNPFFRKKKNTHKFVIKKLKNNNNNNKAFLNELNCMFQMFFQFNPLSLVNFKEAQVEAMADTSQLHNYSGHITVRVTGETNHKSLQ